MGLFSKTEPGAYEINNRAFSCHNCRNNTFWSRKAQLNTATASFFNLDWTDRSATCLVCSECAYIHWFLI